MAMTIACIITVYLTIHFMAKVGVFVKKCLRSPLGDPSISRRIARADQIVFTKEHKGHPSSGLNVGWTERHYPRMPKDDHADDAQHYLYGAEIAHMYGM